MMLINTTSMQARQVLVEKARHAPEEMQMSTIQIQSFPAPDLFSSMAGPTRPIIGIGARD